MAWFGLRKRPARAVDRAGFEHLEAFVRSRLGVEGFIEPRTTVTETTLLLVAHDGEWTRRRVPSPEAARRFAHGLALPIYDVRLLGYPQRMRDYNHRQKLRPGWKDQPGRGAETKKPEAWSPPDQQRGDGPTDPR